MKLGMHNPWQATIKLPGVADNTSAHKVTDGRTDGRTTDATV